MDEQLIIGVEICLDDVDLFLQLFGDLDNLLDAETFRLSIFTWRRVNTAVT